MAFIDDQSEIGASVSGERPYLNWRRKEAVAGIFLLLVFWTLAGPDVSPGQRDFIGIWAVGRLAVQGQNPYDPVQIFALEKQEGFQSVAAMVMREPPWFLWMTLPFGYLDPATACRLWIALSLACFAVSVRICFRFYPVDRGGRRWLLFAAYGFAPVLACLLAGQLGLILLLGVCLFLLWREDRPVWAGAALALLAAKPHLFTGFWVALFLWVLYRRRWRIVYGAAGAFLLATVCATLIDSSVFRHYWAAMRLDPVGPLLIPSLSGIMRALLARHHLWVQFVPAALVIVWSVWFYSRHSQDWNWEEHGPALLVASILVAPYSWFCDDVIVLPAILQATAWVYAQRRQLGVGGAAGILAFVGLYGLLLLMVISKVPMPLGVYFWSSLVWFGWYRFGWRRKTTHESDARGEIIAGSL
jgi:Glycosyltransferase family 87